MVYRKLVQTRQDRPRDKRILSVTCRERTSRRRQRTPARNNRGGYLRDKRNLACDVDSSRHVSAQKIRLTSYDLSAF